MVPVLNTVLRRRILLIYLTVCLIFYVLAILSSLGRTDAWGEWIATSLVAIGLLAAAPRPATGWRYRVALFCACAAPPIALISHTELAAQVWALIPLILIAVFVRSWHRTRTARLVTAALGLGADAGLLIAPAPVPPLWLLMFPVCIMGIAEVIGLVAPSPRAQNALPRMLSQRSSSRSMSPDVPWPASRRPSTCASQNVPSRHGVHLPHDSCL